MHTILCQCLQTNPSRFTLGSSKILISVFSRSGILLFMLWLQWSQGTSSCYWHLHKLCPYTGPPQTKIVWSPLYLLAQAYIPISSLACRGNYYFLVITYKVSQDKFYGDSLHISPLSASKLS